MEGSKNFSLVGVVLAVLLLVLMFDSAIAPPQPYADLPDLGSDPVDVEDDLGKVFRDPIVPGAGLLPAAQPAKPTAPQQAANAAPQQAANAAPQRDPQAANLEQAKKLEIQEMMKKMPPDQLKAIMAETGAKNRQELEAVVAKMLMGEEEDEDGEGEEEEEKQKGESKAAGGGSKVALEQSPFPTVRAVPIKPKEYADKVIKEAVTRSRKPENRSASREHRSSSVSPPKLPTGSKSAVSPPKLPTGSKSAVSPPKLPTGSKSAVSPPKLPTGSKSAVSPPKLPTGSKSAAPPLLPILSPTSMKGQYPMYLLPIVPYPTIQGYMVPVFPHNGMPSVPNQSPAMLSYSQQSPYQSTLGQQANQPALAFHWPPGFPYAQTGRPGTQTPIIRTGNLRKAD